MEKVNTLSNYIFKVWDDVRPFGAVFIAGANYILFPDEAFKTAVMAVSITMILDILTKYYAISKQNGGFLNAVKVGKIYSKSFWEGTKTKIISYLVISILAGISYRVVIFKSSSVFLCSFVYFMIFLRETHSIIENLIDAGSDLHWLLVIVKKKETQVLNQVSTDIVKSNKEEDSNE